MTKDSQLDIIARLVECGLDEKHATIVMDLATHPPSKASEVGKRIGISRMDAYNALKKNARYGSHKGDTGQTNGVFGHQDRRSLRSADSKIRNGPTKDAGTPS